MRVLRQTMYPPIGIDGPVTIVFREIDLNCSIEEAVEHASAPPAEMWIAFDVFVVPDGASAQSASSRAIHRQQDRAENEKNMSIAFYWFAKILNHVHDHGIVHTTKPAPLDAWALADVASRLAKHPAYKNQTVVQIARDGRLVRLREGQVSIEPRCVEDEPCP